MRRAWLGLLLAAVAALPLRAQESPDSAATAPAAANDGSKGPLHVDPQAIQKGADDLHDAVASPNVTEFSVHSQAAGFFENVQRETPIVHPAPRKMDRETVNGQVAAIDGDKDAMMESAQKRYDHYRLTTREVPSDDLAKSVDFAKDMRAQNRADFDHDGKMPDNDLGVFRYNKDQAGGGVIELNPILQAVATRIGPAFCYLTLVHEGAHALARSLGWLSPEHVIDGEVFAYRVQYQMLKVLDPSAERTIVLLSTLQLELEKHPEDLVTRASIGILKFQLDLWDTHGEEPKLREMIKRLGYEEGDGVNPGAKPVRA